MDIFLRANLLQNFGPDADGDFAEMRLTQNQHEGARLPNASTDAERNIILHDGLVVGKLQEVKLGREFKLLAKRFGIDADTHGTEFMAAFCDVVPDQNVTIQAVALPA